VADRPRIALIHAVPAAVDPIKAALASGWPEAEPVNLLDDSLSTDRAKDEDLTPALAGRIVALARYACELGARGILFTCSAFGPAIERAARELPVPVLKPNEALFEEAVLRGKRVGMLATFEPAVATMEAEFRAEARRLGSKARLETVLVAGAMDALRAGDAAGHNRLVAERAVALEGCDVVLLAHFSTSRAAGAVRAALRVPVLTSPEAAVAKLRRIVTEPPTPASASTGPSPGPRRR
jgi:aspartate/glutamate racemase